MQDAEAGDQLLGVVSDAIAVAALQQRLSAESRSFTHSAQDL